MLIYLSGAVSAECLPTFEREQRADLDSYYTVAALGIVHWRDGQFRYALSQYNHTIRNQSKTIYEELEAQKTNLRYRIVNGDLRDATQAERTKAAVLIGTEFRRKMMTLRIEAKREYNLQIARVRENVADMRRNTADEYARGREYLREFVANGCIEKFDFSLRSIFLWVSNRIGPSEPAPDENPVSSIGIRG